MKGPGIRIDLDVRRTWKCPVCGSVRRTAGDVQSVRCRCRDDGAWMALVDRPRSRPLIPPPARIIQELPASEMEGADTEPPLPAEITSVDPLVEEAG